jgi:hypothetical protein
MKNYKILKVIERYPPHITDIAKVYFASEIVNNGWRTFTIDLSSFWSKDGCYNQLSTWLVDECDCENGETVLLPLMFWND